MKFYLNNDNLSTAAEELVNEGLLSKKREFVDEYNLSYPKYEYSITPAGRIVAAALK